MVRRAGFKRKCGNVEGFQLFERSSGGILNLTFDSNLLESYYQECSFSRATCRFRFGSLYASLAYIAWIIYFSIERPFCWEYYISGLAFGVALSMSCYVTSFIKKFFKKYHLWICGIYSGISGILVLLPFISSVPPVSLAFHLNGAVQLVLLTYTMLPLRLWQLLLICGPLSVSQVVLASCRYGYIGWFAILIHIVGHLCAHFIGIILHLMFQVWRRSTFLRLGYNALMRKALKKEQETRDDMIKSLMPGDVAQEVMRDVGNGEDSDAANGDAGRSRSRNKRTRKKRHSDARGDGMDDISPSGVGFSDDFFDDEEDAETSKKHSVVSNVEADGQITSPDDVEANPGSPRASLVPKAGAPAHAVSFRKFHVNQLENVSVLFADIVGFTKMSSNKTASHLVYLLNDLFGRFDLLCERTGCEKIATLGDCYYCVAGCPKPVSDHAERAVEMGRAMCVAIQQFDEDHHEEVNMRVGVHTGKVICGIVGTRRFKYDVWSNDVTLANEMESSGKPGQVHISEATLGFVKDIYEVSEGEAVQDIRKFKVLVEFFSTEEQCFAIKHTQDEAKIKTYFIEKRLDGKPPYSLPPMEIDAPPKESSKPGSGESPNVTVAPPAPTQPLSTSPLISNTFNQAPHLQTDRNGGSEMHNLNQGTAEQSKAPYQHRYMHNRESDVDMLQALQDLAKTEEVFAFPPISRITLNFHSNVVEACYRRLGLRRPKGPSVVNLSWSTPRIAPLINALTETIVFVIVFITCVIIFPDSRIAAYSPTFYVVSTLAVVIHVLFLTLLVADLAAWGLTSRPPEKSSRPGCDWRRCTMRTYIVCFQWYMRNMIGAVFLILPTAVILSNFCGAFFKGVDFYPSLFIAHYRNLCGLLFSFMIINFTLFTSFSSWTKSFTALLACLLVILLIFLPCTGSSPFAFHVYENVWLDHVVHWSQLNETNSLGNLPIWTRPVLESDFYWELALILLLTFVLVGALNREFDISFRLSFHRDYEARLAKQAITHQKIQADWLLKNIIPYYIVDDLRQHNKYSRHIDDAAVVFACISNFSEFYDEQYQGGQEMLRVLNEIFADFEHQLTAVKYKDVEKIKTIGSCFMGASGLNMIERVRNKRPDEHLWALMDFALDLIRTLDDFNRQMFNFQFEMKVGYNIGEVTAGVIGTTKLLYDIWGDTVNVASRMYSTGKKGRIQVTEAVAKRLESRYEFEYRGEVFVKGKGDMKTYLLVRRRQE
ncbi:unnamed protein product [Calicophoron daubneyi]|uniref:adenylate cyclase n=1 Tax=Calicophoron daubneyi TaxID=300641 RepID=A0AAV2TJ70_CALDB